MVLIIIFAILFFCGAIHNLITGEYVEGTAGITISAILGMLYIYFKKQHNYTNSFLSWLTKNKDALTSEEHSSITYRETPININTEATSYLCCFSFVVFSIKISSRLIIKGESNEDINKFFINSVYTVFTLIFGWWGIPFGPIYTIQSVYRNVRGGNRTTVRTLLGGLL